MSWHHTNTVIFTIFWKSTRTDWSIVTPSQCYWSLLPIKKLTRRRFSSALLSNYDFLFYCQMVDKLLQFRWRTFFVELPVIYINYYAGLTSHHTWCSLSMSGRPPLMSGNGRHSLINRGGRPNLRILTWYEVQTCTNVSWKIMTINECINLVVCPVCILQTRNWFLLKWNWRHHSTSLF